MLLTSFFKINKFGKRFISLTKTDKKIPLALRSCQGIFFYYDRGSTQIVFCAHKEQSGLNFNIGELDLKGYFVLNVKTWCHLA